MKVPTLEKIFKVSEQVIYAAWESVDKDENSGFAVVLKAADEYRKADMTPMFIVDGETMQIYCFAEETFGKRLN